MLVHNPTNKFDLIRFANFPCSGSTFSVIFPNIYSLGGFLLHTVELWNPSSCIWIKCRIAGFLFTLSYHTVLMAAHFTKHLSFRPATDSRVLRKSRRDSVWQQVWPDGSESSERRRGPWPGGEVRVRLRLHPSVQEPLPQVFVKKAVAALFAKVCAGICCAKLVLLEKQIFVYMCKISC